MTGHLSTASAVWALVAFGLNTAAQDGGDLLWLDSRWSFFIWATPWGCGLDMIHLILIICIETIVHRSIRPALQHAPIARGRKEPSSKTRKRTYIEVIILIVAISQLVKLMSGAGLLVVQILAVAYTISYALQLLVNCFSVPELYEPLPQDEWPTNWNRRHERGGHGPGQAQCDLVASLYHQRYPMAQLWPVLLSVVAAYALFMYVAMFLDSFCGASSLTKECPPGQTDCVTCTHMILIQLLICYLAIDVITNRTTPSLLSSYWLRAVWTGVYLWFGIRLYSSKRSELSAAAATEASPHTVLWFLILVGALAFYLMSQIPNLIWGGWEHPEERLVQFEIALFVLANMAAIALYFAEFYDPAVTTKPGWADYLG